MTKNISFLTFLMTLFGVSTSLYIKSLNVPAAILANSSEVILDCVYIVDEWERKNGFVLKWYINSVNLVYQWIPPQLPQVLGTLKGKVDPTYKASVKQWEEYRALRILKPNPSLSGDYRCTVATFETEDSDSAKMLVWAAPRKIEFHYWRPSETYINVTCKAYDVAPRPEFQFYLIDTNGERHALAVLGRTDEKTFQKGHFISQSWGLVVDAYSSNSNDFRIFCTVTIPGTPYLESREKIYYPDIPIISSEKLSYTKGKSSPPEEGAVRLPTLSDAVSLHIRKIDYRSWTIPLCFIFLIINYNEFDIHNYVVRRSISFIKLVAVLLTFVSSFALLILPHCATSLSESVVWN